MRIRDWLAHSRVVLQHSESPKRDGEILLGYVLEKSRSWLIAFDDTILTASQLAQLDELLNRRQQGEPVAHLLGEREFWSLPLKVNNSTLIPRPDTEVLVEVALELLPETPCEVLDLGTGSGAIALALGSERPDCVVTGVDRVAEAVELAQQNAAQLALNHCHFKQSNWFSQLPASRFQLIVSNPPYIDADDYHLQQGDVRFEPLSALVAEEGGWQIYDTLLNKAATGCTLTAGWCLSMAGSKERPCASCSSTVATGRSQPVMIMQVTRGLAMVSLFPNRWQDK